MNDNGLPNDPLMAAQFGVPAMTRIIISQLADRSFGEFFPALGGDYLRVESVDMPARISFGNTDFNQSIPLLSGMTIDGNFDGFTVYHDALGGFTNARPNIVLNIGRGNKIIVDSQSSKTLLPFPLSITLTTTGGTLAVPVPYGYKSVSLAGVIYVTNATAPFAANFLAALADTNNVVILPGTLVRLGRTFTTLSATKAWIAPFVALSATTWAASFDVVLPVATGGEYFSIPFSYPAVTSTDFARITALGF